MRQTVWMSLLIPMLVIGSTATADEQKDDVYYWPSDYQARTIEDTYTIDNENSALETYTTGSYQTRSNKPEVYFIEDYETQHSDTIVKAVIRR